MKLSILAVIAGLLLSSSGFAKHGNGGDKDILARGSQAWFLVESVEHLVRGLVKSGTISQEGVTFAETSTQSPTSARVYIKASSGSYDDNCIMYDHWSHSGTILKKDVRCQKIPYYGDKFDLTRGTDAWAVAEGLEHSLRLAVMSDARVLNDAIAGESSLLGDKSVSVTIKLKDSRQLRYLCLRQYYGAYDPNSLNCAPQQ